MKCTNPNCNYDVDGYCIDGLPLEDCPSFNEGLDLELISPEGVDSSEGDFVEPSDPDNKIPFWGQKPLSEGAASSTMKAFPSKVISFVGPVGVGKTTLISSMYDVFNRRNQLNVRFGHSHSIYAFEKLCHHARVTSNSSEVSTPRTTSADGVTFYNLSILDSSDNRHNVYLADRSGESYSEMLNDVGLVKQYSELSRSDLICILIDSSTLGDKAKRHRYKRQTINLIKALISQLQAFEKNNFVLLLTKYDLVEGTVSEELCKKEVGAICQKVQQDHAIGLSCIHLSARPFLEEQEKPDAICELWDLITQSERSQSRIKFTRFRSERSFHNLELMYD
ncbi:50S ribosome-binding GTPase [Vibrio sp. SCSIO 43135]|uniref:TRAFAC clade GTPase domain-containing protein n=1 Tax=Vibrio sp. SCSIO 43135 TaxID=2819096 RepID=UPI0020758332|nr:GTPase [Vibrio sp. SCSIO 43135]USD41244.1 50S ribosome-binding GTPase [Vibrio sp. SCSIO 43135]